MLRDHASGRLGQTLPLTSEKEGLEPDREINLFGIDVKIDAQRLENLICKVVAETIVQLGIDRATLNDQSKSVDEYESMLLKPGDAAKALAISQRTLWDLTHSGEIPHVQIGRAVRYDRLDLRTWIQGQKRRNPKNSTE
jgi:excisionase family DNA binding protein